MRDRGVRPVPGRRPPCRVGIDRADTLDELLRAADVVSVHVPLTDASRGMFGADAVRRDEAGRRVHQHRPRRPRRPGRAARRARAAGQLVGAGLDVTVPEPLPPDHPLLGRDDVVVTPHVASATSDGKARIFRAAFEQAMAVVDGRRPEHLVNPEVWDRVAARPYAGVGT